jgi:hypothetical protein
MLLILIGEGNLPHPSALFAEGFESITLTVEHRNAPLGQLCDQVEASFLHVAGVSKFLVFLLSEKVIHPVLVAWTSVEV